MCGIAGTFGSLVTHRAIDNKTIELMRQRGPDASGIHKTTINGNHVQLLHSRLAIIDLDKRSNQPFQADNCVLTFNGEIYNYIELRDELLTLGHQFVSSSDTEVIIKAYRQWGLKCFQKFEGMWAMALLDKSSGKLILCRDRFGEKPLYYYTLGDTLYFASEIKYIDSLLGDERLQINVDKIKRYMVFGFKTLYKDPTETYYLDVKSLPPASYMELDAVDRLDIKQYWSVGYNPVTMTMDEAVSGARHHLEESLKIRLRSDVPLAFCLSGGIDSSTLVGMAVKKFGVDAHTFSVIDSDKRYDERDNIESTIDYLGCRNYFAKVDNKGFLDRLKRLVQYHDSPVSTISYYVHSFLSEEISQRGYKVVISGTAADEIFTGYYDHYNLWLAEMAGREDYDKLLNDWRDGYGKFVRNPVLKDPECYIKDPGSREHIYLKSDLFNSFMIEPLTAIIEDAVYDHHSILRNRMLNEIRHEIVPVILKEDDCNSMMWSLENRSPFLDSKLVEFMYSVPNEHLVDHGYVKWLLRAAGEDLYPDSVRLSKEKKGFNASINSVIDLHDEETREHLLSDSDIFNIVDKGKFESFLEQDMSSNSNSKYLFSFISAKTFLDTTFASCS